MFDETDQIADLLNQRELDEGMRYGLHSFGEHIARIQWSWIRADIPLIRYEDLILDERRYFEEIVALCQFDMPEDQLAAIIKTYTFESKSGRSRGTEDVHSHLRKGERGDWRNYLTGNLLMEFKELYDDLLIETGYEQNRDWGLDLLPRSYSNPLAQVKERIKKRSQAFPSEVRCWCGSRNLGDFSPDYYRCQSCGTLVGKYLVTMSDLLGQDEKTAFYGEMYWQSPSVQAFGGGDIDELARIQLTHTRTLEYLGHVLKYLSPGSRILDLGCGAGYFGALLKNAGFEVVGLELTEWTARYAAEAFGLQVVSGPIETQAFPPESFDAIIAINVIEHFPNPHQSLEHCLRLLKPDGVFIIRARLMPPNVDYDFLFSKGADLIRLLRPIEHVHLFNPKSIEDLLRSIGCREVVIENRGVVIAGKRPFKNRQQEDVRKVLQASPNGCIIDAILDLQDRIDTAQKRLDEDRDVAFRQLGRIQERETIEVDASQMQTDSITTGEGWYVVETGDGELFRWIYNDAELVIHAPTGFFDTLALDIEPGPGVNMTSFNLYLLDERGRSIGKAVVYQRQKVYFKLPITPHQSTTFYLHVEEGGLPSENDPRVINFRVFSYGWTLKKLEESQPDSILLGAHWYPLEEFEGERFNWAANNAEIIIHKPTAENKIIQLELEAGPGIGRVDFELQVLDQDNQIIAARRIYGRDTLQVPLSIQPGVTQTFRLYTVDGGQQTPGDPRTLNFRLFKANWQFMDDRDAITLGEGWYGQETAHGEKFHWANNDAEIVIHAATGIQHLIHLEIEPGPSIGKPEFDLQILDSNRRPVTTLKVAGRRTIEVPLLIATGENNIFYLHTEQGGKPIPTDPRILNFRLFKIHWKTIPQPDEITFEEGWYPQETVENEQFRWAMPEALLTIHTPTGFYRTLQLEIQPGPSLGKTNFDLTILDGDGRKVAVVPVSGRQFVEVPLPITPNVTTSFRLVTPKGGKQASSSDPRLLYFRVFSLGWKPIPRTDAISLGEGWYLVERNSKGETFNWANNDAEFIVHSPSGISNILQLDLQVGPSINKPDLDFDILDSNGYQVAHVRVVGRQRVEVPLPVMRWQTTSFWLHTQDNGSSIPGESRILNFRLFKINWKPIPKIDELELGDGWYPTEVMDGEYFRWAGNNAEIIVHSPSGFYQTLQLELQAGPGIGKPSLELNVIDPVNKNVTTIEVVGRQTIEIPIPITRGETTRLYLRTKEGGKTIPDDPRILNFRLFKINWKPKELG
jgi:SAM-dependent methyltransferase